MVIGSSLLIGGMLLLLIVLWRKRRKKAPIDFHDPYDLTKALRQKGSSAQIEELLKELEKYKYRPDAPPLPQKLIRRVKKVLQ